MFWDQDSAVYNFHRVKRLYFLLNYSNQVIGGTSPATVFFAAPDVTTASSGLNIACGHDILFDNEYVPPYQKEMTKLLSNISSHCQNSLALPISSLMFTRI